MKKIVLIVLVISLFMIAGCAVPEQAQPPANDEQVEVVNEVPATGDEKVDEQIVVKKTEVEPSKETEAKIVEIKVTAKKWEFNPSEVRVTKGDTVKFTVESIDVTHGFFLPTFGVNLKLTPGETKIVEFVADKEGTFTFSCNVFCGSGHGGMKGTLIVE